MSEQMAETALKASSDNAPVRGACPHDCPDTCALLTTVENGRAIKVQGNPAHRPTDGVLCTKVSRYAERTYHPERLLTPLQRSGPKGAGQFVPVSWDEALDAIAAKLTSIAQDYPEAVLPYSYAGTMGQVQGEAMAGRFFHRPGASLPGPHHLPPTWPPGTDPNPGPTRWAGRWNFLPNPN